MNLERSAELFETIGDPIAGALWSGPPFESRVWRAITLNRNPRSPARLALCRGWLAVTGVGHCSPDALARLKEHLGKAARTAAAGTGDGNPYRDRGG